MGVHKSSVVRYQGEKDEKKDTLETETLNDILNELKTLNNNFKTIEKTMKSKQSMYPPVIHPSNTLTNLLNNIDFEKLSVYECGFEPFTDTQGTFDIKFYLLAMLFMVFDLEIMFLLP
jgi:hypothetical protein